MGAALGTQWAATGHTVTFSYSRDPRRLEALARATKGKASAANPAEAAEKSEVILVAVPWHVLDDALAQAGSLAGKIVITCSIPMTEDGSDLAIGHTTSGAEELACRLPEAQVVAAFNTIPSELIVDPGRPNRPERPEVIYCGDDAEAKQTVAGLIRDTGFEPVDAGPCGWPAGWNPSACSWRSSPMRWSPLRSWGTASCGLEHRARPPQCREPSRLYRGEGYVASRMIYMYITLALDTMRRACNSLCGRFPTL
jgi:8-hydroxy-5-deazaflavin:NADPH oxidoreductase